MLASRQNPRFQQVLRLKQRKYRQQQKEFLAEGPLPIKEGLAQKRVLRHLVFCREMLSPAATELIADGLPLLEVSPALMKLLADTDTPQGVVGVFGWPDTELAGLSGDLLLVVDGLQDPGNTGSVLRTAAAVGVSAVLSLKGSVDLTAPKVVRASMGGIFQVPWIQNITPAEAADWLGAKGIKPVAMVPGEGTPFHRFDYSGNLALVVGNEAAGISSEIADICREGVTIPMPGNTQSLNASVAVALVLYQAAIARKIM